MKHFLVTLTIFLFWSLLGIWFFALINPNEATAATRNPIPNEVPDRVIEVLPIVDEETEAEVERSAFQILDDSGSPVFSDSEGFVIAKNSATVDDSKVHQDYLRFLVQLLEEDAYLRLYVIGTYSAEENIVQPNYGLQRAQEVKSKLVSAGIPSGRMEVKASISPLEFEGDRYNKGIQMQLFKVAAPWSSREETLVWYPVLEFDTIVEDDALVAVKQQVRSMLEQDPTLLVEVVGHTDQVGSGVDNYRAGLKWARQVRGYLIRSAGVPRKQITAISKGESEPVNPDGTLSAGVVNKRIEINFN